MWPFIFLHCRCELPITYEGKIGGKSLSKILNLEYNTESGQNKNSKLGIHSFAASRSSIKGIVGEQASKFACCAIGKGTGLPHLCVVDRWPETRKRSYNAFGLFFTQCEDKNATK